MRVQRGSDGTILNAAVLSPSQLTHERVLCPACMLEVFEKWPEGWDAHAAHRCEGVNLGTPEERKAEFLGVLGHLFRDGERQSVTPIQLDQLVEFVRTLEGRVLQTLVQHKAFTVTVEAKGFVYTPTATGRARLHRFPRNCRSARCWRPAARAFEGGKYLRAAANGPEIGAICG